jgi:hypothetical protein
MAADFIKTFQVLKENGYGIHIHALAVPEGISKLGIYLRYHDHLAQGKVERMVPISTHDINYAGLLTNLRTIHTDHPELMDSITVYKRSILKAGNTIQNNKIESIHSSSYPIRMEETLSVIKKERERKFTLVEIEYLEGKINRTESLIAEQGGDLQVFRQDMETLRGQLKISG